MIEKSHTAGLWPALYEPFRNMGTRMAEWLAPASDASSDENSYLISVELPGVNEKDIDVSVHDGVVSVKAKKHLSGRKRAIPGFSQSVSMDRSAAVSACRRMRMAIRLMPG